MKTSRLLVLLGISIALAFAAGFAIAQRRYAPPPPRAQKAPTQSGLAGEVQAALTLPDRVKSVHEVSAILLRSTPDDLAQIRAGFESVFLDVAEIEIVLLAEWWAAFDPEAAFRWTQGTRVANQTMVIRSVVRAWARRDPTAARDAVARLLDPITRRACLDALVSGWDDSGKPGLEAYLRELPPSVEQLRALAALARRKVLREGAEGALAWVESLPEDREGDITRFKLQLFRRVASAAASVDLERAAAWAVKHSDGPYGDGLLGRVGNTWAMRDGAAAMEWVGSLPESPRRSAAVEDTYRAWLDWDSAAALAWMRERRLEPWLEPALALYVVASAPTDHAAALERARDIQDPQRRDSVIVTIARMWRGSAPEAADAWIAQAELEPAVREQILRDVAPGAGGPVPQSLEEVVPGGSPRP